MNYWARSIPPLKQEKGYFETTAELMEWIDWVLCRSPIHVEKAEDHFVVLKVDLEKNPQLKKVFGENKEERKTPKMRRLPHLRSAFPHPRVKKND